MLQLRKNHVRGQRLTAEAFGEDFENLAQVQLQNPNLPIDERAETLFELAVFQSLFHERPAPELFTECIELAMKTNDYQLATDAARHLYRLTSFVNMKKLDDILHSPEFLEAGKQAIEFAEMAIEFAALAGDAEAAVAAALALGLDFLQTAALHLNRDYRDQGGTVAKIVKEIWPKVEEMARTFINEVPELINDHLRSDFENMRGCFQQLATYRESLNRLS